MKEDIIEDMSVENFTAEDTDNMFDFYNKEYETLQCPVCKVRNLDSTIKQINVLSPIAYCPPEFLEILGEHEHDENYIVSSFLCSRAHEFELKLFKSCHCGWME